MPIHYDDNHWRTLVDVIIDRIGLEKVMILVNQAQRDRMPSVLPENDRRRDEGGDHQHQETKEQDKTGVVGH